ncbi:hypothetical protein BT96DRAFT_946740 [Gymnopus androsaceus JB14]|uniref:CxC1-like cysteine cluster associated with KDZ transposases domain-containing protein n=1 Tax=Gymnopus androsaceus JB14 TaxID=1447944 RepID=A0A6A4GX00_9AGAR|nr:hypothetical protein BT96DRAFT_946740 [Gymnopus androsaceus JB14]
MAHRDFATHRIVTTTEMLKKRAKRKHKNGEDDCLYNKVLMNIDDGHGEQSNSGSEGAPTQTVEPGDQWEDEEEEEEELLYFRAKEHATYQIPVFQSDRLNNASYIHSGFLPFNPLVNESLVSLQMVELYHNLFMRCPRLGVQPFIRALCDLQGVHFKNNLSVQFSSAYDLYIQLTEPVRQRVLDALGRNTPNWQMLNACPPCQYEVEGETPQPIQFMAAVDGNNSLKRVEQRERTEDGMLLGPSKERPDARVGGGDYFLQPVQVDLWDEPNWGKWVDWVPTGTGSKNLCTDHWSNLNENMIKTGEQSKYLLALLHHFMAACQEDRRHRGLPEEPIGSLAIGYNIACGMVDKISHSPLNQLAKDEKLQMLIGLLHGYAHNHLCQLTFLMLYIYGAGIEDLEVCERYFSHSNALASVTRYMSQFCRHQWIASYAYHWDNFEMYPNLSKFIYSNYKQALGILNRAKDTARMLKLIGIVDVGKLAACQERLRRARQTFQSYGQASLGAGPEEEQPLSMLERQMANEQELEAKLLLDVQSLEERLKIRRDQRWSRGSEEWNKAEELVSMAAYQKALDKLEGLIVARIFELSRMNVSGTGHTMQKRSAAIHSGLESYNQAAAKLRPPRKLLNWDDVLNYTYLSEFDFLRDTHSDVRDKIWAKPKVREAVSELFKLLRTGEKIDKLHVEIKRLVTYMNGEEEYIPAVARKVHTSNPALAYQIQCYGNERGRFNVVHCMQLNSIQKLVGFKPSDMCYLHPGAGFWRQTVNGLGEGNMLDRPLYLGDDDEDNESEDDNEEAKADDWAEAALAVANDSL